MFRKNDVFTLEDLKSIAEEQGKIPCISLYMPAHKTGKDQMQDPIRFKNLVKKAIEYCQNQGIRRDDAKKILAPSQKLMENPLFWQHQSDGLAIFAAPNVFRYYRLPIKFSELTAVGCVFIFKPLFYYLSEYGRFYLLQLSKNRVKLYQGAIDAISELDCSGLPENLESALWYKDHERQLQMHHAGGPAEKSVFFHSHGVGRDDLKFRIKRYLRHVNKSLNGFIKDKNIPLVVASVDYFLPIYQEVNTYPKLINKAVSGNPDSVSETTLHKKAWEIAQEFYEAPRKAAIKNCADKLETESGSYIPKDIVKLAWQGKIAELFAPFGKQIWGKFNRGNGEAELHLKQEPDDIDILSLAVFFTYLHNGKVYIVKLEAMPAKTELAAVLRK